LIKVFDLFLSCFLYTGEGERECDLDREFLGFFHIFFVSTFGVFQKTGDLDRPLIEFFSDLFNASLVCQDFTFLLSSSLIVDLDIPLIIGLLA
jgi:hypothetical protein